jgi:hypothetical protein
MWLYIIGPFAGGLIASLVFTYTQNQKIR